MANVKRAAKQITNKEELDYILGLSDHDCLKLSVNMEFFGEFNGKTKYHPYDWFVVPKGTYHGNKNDFTTTIGLWIFNKACLSWSGVWEELGYINEEITKKLFGTISTKLSYAVLEGRVQVPQYKRMIDAIQKLFPLATVICPVTSEEMLTIGKAIAPKKKELLKKYEKEIAAGDALTMNKIEKELLDTCAEILKDDPAMDNINSGAGSSWGNNFKNMYVIKGAQKNPDPTKGYNLITSNFMEGVSREDYVAMANSLAAGPYARAKNTAEGGYAEKLFLGATQHLQLDERGSDCGTKRTIEITLDSTRLRMCMYSYIVEGSKLVRLDSTNMDKYKGKTVKMRFSSLCKNKKICNKCAGDLFYLMGIKNIGTTVPQLASCVKNISMKAFHDSTDKYIEMDAGEAFGE